MTIGPDIKEALVEVGQAVAPEPPAAPKPVKKLLVQRKKAKK